MPGAPQRSSRFDEQPEHHYAIIVGQLDQPGFGYKATEFDELPRSLATLHR